jgi:putative tricarboxylic transport membrane protein
LDLLSNLATGFSVALSPINLVFVTIGVVAGTLIGALPGIGPVAGIAILLPLAYGMEPVTAMILMAGIYYGTMFGGTITAVLVGVPGEASTIPTCLDGHAMAKQGRAGPALTIAAIASFTAGTFSVVVLMLAAPVIARAALSFGPPEYFALMLLGLTSVAGLVGKAKLKGYATAVLGLMLSLVGFDLITGHQRFTFGQLELADGVKFLPVAVGLFGIAEVLVTLERIAGHKVVQARLREMVVTREDLADSAPAIARGTVIGFLIGLLPGAGGAVASLLSYATEQRFAKRPERFGQGEIAGVAGPDAASNGSTGGAMIPMLTLGIPGSATMAVMLGALSLFNIQPGPFLFRNHPEFVWGLIASMYIGNFMLLVINIVCIPLFVSALRVPFSLLAPLIVVFATVGVYSIGSSFIDLWVLYVFGVLGYFMRKTGYPAAPLVLALVLGNGLETSLRQSLMIAQGDISIFFTRPISGPLMLLVGLVVLWPLLQATLLPRLRGPALPAAPVLRPDPREKGRD